jgi:light-regulated signal transduction histidine kinase (bacteriophytochrome)
MIENTVTKMIHLLSETLDLSQIGRVANPPEDVPFIEIVHGALMQTSGMIKSQGIDVSVSDDLSIIHVDCMKIE